MPDRCFEAYLRDVVSVLKLSLTAGVNKLIETANSVPCRLHPVSGAWDQVSVGPVTGERWVGYLSAMDLEAGDFLVERIPEDALAADATAGASQIRVMQPENWNADLQVCIGSGESFELAMVTEIEDDILDLQNPLSYAHTATEEVSGAIVYEVLSVIDEAGAGHHLRVELVKRQGIV